MAEPIADPNPMRHAAAGLEFILTFGAFLVAGILLDRRFGSMPGFTLLISAVGFLVALRRLVQSARRHDRQQGEPHSK